MTSQSAELSANFNRGTQNVRCGYLRRVMSVNRVMRDPACSRGRTYPLQMTQIHTSPFPLQKISKATNDHLCRCICPGL